MVVAGLRDIGENRIQEAADKFAVLDDLLADAGVDPRSLRRHFIGHLQSNKAAAAVELFDVIHSVDSEHLATKLGEAAARIGKQISCLVQVNTTGEVTKSGVGDADTVAVIEAIISQPSLSFDGLMTIGPTYGSDDEIRTAFCSLRQFRDQQELKYPDRQGKLHLSMGMSGDFPIAIEEGATMIRIGTALFGDRNRND